MRHVSALLDRGKFAHTIEGSTSDTQTFKIRLRGTGSLTNQINRLKQSGLFTRVEPVIVYPLITTVPNEWDYGDMWSQWYLHNVGQDPPDGTVDADIDAIPGWDDGFELPSDVVVVLLDSGFPVRDGSLLHPDLNAGGKYYFGHDYVQDTAFAFTDTLGHGTAMSGIIAAETDNATGIAAVNPTARLLIYKVADAGGWIDDMDIKRAVQSAVDSLGYFVPGAHHIIFNMSFAANYGSDDLESAIDYARDHDSLVCAGSGNWKISWLYYSARYGDEYENVLAVGGTESNDAQWWESGEEYGSHYGSELDVVAPGGDNNGVTEGGIYTTAPGYTNFLGWGTVEYVFVNGTSAATAIASGVASLVWNENPELTAVQVHQIITDTAQKVRTDLYTYDQNGWNNKMGYGRIRMAEALASVPITGLATHLEEREEQKGPIQMAPNQNWQVRLTWDPHYGGRRSRYRVDRSDNGETGWYPRNYPTTEEFTDTDVDDGETYYWRVIAIDSSFDSLYVPSQVVHKTIPNGDPPPPEEAAGDQIGAETNVPTAFTLVPNYPNPFNPSTQIRFGLPEASNVRLLIFNTRGQLVKTLIDGTRPAGWQTVTWEGKDETGRQVSSGIYLYVLEARGHRLIGRMTLIR